MTSGPRSGRARGDGAPSTMREVAAAAGVSLATVSRVLSGHRADDDDIAARVRSAAADLDFRPNPSAQGLRRPVPAVGVVVPDLANPYFAELLKGVNEAAEEAGRRMVVADAREDPDEEVRLVAELLRWTSGLILCSPRMSARQMAEVSASLSHPLVTVNHPAPGRPALLVDFAAAIREICAHLRELGHRHLAYLGGPALSWSDKERRRELRAQARAGLRIDFLACGSAIEDGHAVTDAALATGATALVAFSDQVAIGVLMRAGELGVRVPEDVSLTGFDDIPVSRIAGPGLTTVTVSKPGLGRTAHDMLSLTGARRVRVRPSLVVRGSTAVPAQR